MGLSDLSQVRSRRFLTIIAHQRTVICLLISRMCSCRLIRLPLTLCRTSSQVRILRLDRITDDRISTAVARKLHS